MPVIDAHAHIYPSKIASRAAQSISEAYTIPIFGEGTGEHLVEATATSPISHFIVHSVAAKPENVEGINDFIASQCERYPQFIGFATMHQNYSDMEAEINRAVEKGLRGIKIHPDMQMCNMDDPRFMHLYEIIEGRLPIIIHMGDYRTDFSHPHRLKKVLRAFPDLVVDAAHFGGWSIPDIGYDYLKSENCFVDTASTLRWTGARHLRELVKMFGVDRVMFGSDYPMFDPEKELEPLIPPYFSENDFEKLTWHNAELFAGISIS